MLSFTGVGGQAQSSVPRVAFDAVSIKPADVPKWLPPGLSQMTLRGRRFRADPVTARGLIVQAFQLKEWQVVGGADWVPTDRFTMEATIRSDAPIEKVNTELPELLKGVLEDRFRLHVHKEQRRFRVYALVRARNDGRLGPQLRRSEIDCQAQRRERAAATSTGSAPPSSSDRAKCMSISAGSLILAAGMTMQGLADSLTGGNGTLGSTDRIVVNRTELPGEFDFLLRWSPASGPDGERSNQPPTPVPSQAPDWLRDAVQVAPPADGVSLFSAVREQLGLKLEPRDEPLDVLVIDHIEQPSPN
jgi:uncharacterized protein (TIGR03435 family)